MAWGAARRSLASAARAEGRGARLTRLLCRLQRIHPAAGARVVVERPAYGRRATRVSLGSASDGSEAACACTTLVRSSSRHRPIIAACGVAAAPARPAGDMLARIRKDGVIRSAPTRTTRRSPFQKSDGTFDGFDVDVANEIAKRLGVTATFETPDFSIVEAGNWADRFDISVGSMTITEKRKGVLDFAEFYYCTPAQMAAIGWTSASRRSMGWLVRRGLCRRGDDLLPSGSTARSKLGDGSALAPVPAGAEAR